jgi:D-3-phosphoglycerate dehydrogenase
MKFKALYTDYPWADVDIEQQILGEVDCELIVAPEGDEQSLVNAAVGVDAIITCWAPVTARVIESAGASCRLVARTGIGLDNIDVPFATSHGITVTNVPDYCIQEVVEHSLALLFALGRKIHVYDRATQRGEYSVQLGLPLERMSDQTVGVVGLGQIGSEFARRVVALGMRVLGHNRSRQVPAGVTWVPLEQLLRDSDYVVLLCPLTDQTRHIVDAAALEAMRTTAFLINTARGGLIDHAALAAALDAGQLAGAALDVQAVEPPDLSQSPYNHERVIVTPHAAFYSTRAVSELRQRVARQVVAKLRGHQPENIVNGVI